MKDPLCKLEIYKCLIVLFWLVWNGRFEPNGWIGWLCILTEGMTFTGAGTHRHTHTHINGVERWRLLSICLSLKRDRVRASCHCGRVVTGPGPCRRRRGPG